MSAIKQIIDLLPFFQTCQRAKLPKDRSRIRKSSFQTVMSAHKSPVTKIQSLVKHFPEFVLISAGGQCYVHKVDRHNSLIYVLEEDNIDEGSPYFYLTELAAKCTSKRLVPDYISEKKMKELKEGNCFPVMGCRSALSPWKDENGNYKFYGRFNQGVVTINLVDVALSSGGDEDKFWKVFDERLDLCYRALMCRHNRLKGTLS